MLITQKTLTGKTPRRFEESDPEFLRKSPMGHYAKFDGRFFFVPFDYLHHIVGVTGFSGKLRCSRTPVKR